MKIITRHVTWEFIKLLFICLVIFISLFLIIDFIQKIDNFSDSNVSLRFTLSYFINKIPYIIVQIIPVACLISVITTFYLMKRNNEIIAMKTCGLDILQLLWPIIVLGIIISVLTFLFSEFIVPYTSSKSNEIWKIRVEKQDMTKFYGSRQIWYKSANSIYWIRNFQGDKEIMDDPSFFFFDDNFRLIRKINATRGIWKDDSWILENGIIQELNKNGDYELKRFTKLPLDIPESPSIFMRGVKNPEEMSYQQLKQFSDKVQKEGYDNTSYLIDMDVKISQPFINLILLIIGIPVALIFHKGGIPLSVSIGILICFIYMLFFGFARSLGLSGILPPFLSAWSANLVFLFVGIYLMMSIER